MCLELLSLHKVVPLQMPERNHALQAGEVTWSTCSSAVSVTYSFLSFSFNIESINHTNLLSPLFHVLSSLLVCCLLGFPGGVSVGLGEARSCLDPDHVGARPHGDVSPLPDGFRLLL